MTSARTSSPPPSQHAKSIAYPYLNSRGEPAYWRDVGSLYSYWKANIELCDIEPELNLYERDWPIWTYQSQSPPAKFAFDDEGRRGQAIDSLVAGGCIISGAKVKRSVIFFNTQIETGTYVKESVILPKVRIGKNCLMQALHHRQGYGDPRRSSRSASTRRKTAGASS